MIQQDPVTTICISLCIWAVLILLVQEVFNMLDVLMSFGIVIGIWLIGFIILDPKSFIRWFK